MEAVGDEPAGLPGEIYGVKVRQGHELPARGEAAIDGRAEVRMPVDGRPGRQHAHDHAREDVLGAQDLLEAGPDGVEPAG